MRIGKTAMNKSSRQESNVLKATFEKEYGVSTEEVYKAASQGVAIAIEVIRKLGFYIRGCSSMGGNGMKIKDRCYASSHGIYGLILDMPIKYPN